MAILVSRRFGCALLAFGASLVIGSGCQMGAGRLVPSPLTFDQQRNKILEIVSPGASRDEVESRLKEAGIEGQFGINESVYYCDIWTQENGDRWPIDVALLFDENGELYKTRPATAETHIETRPDRMEKRNAFSVNAWAEDRSPGSGGGTRSVDRTAQSGNGGSQSLFPTTVEDLNQSVMAPR